MELKLNKQKRKHYDIKHETFDEYCYSIFTQLTSAEREKLPIELVTKVIKLNKNKRWIDKLSFSERMFIIWFIFKRPFYIFIPSENHDTLSYRHFESLRENINNPNLTIEETGNIMSNFGFCLGNGELVDAMFYLNTVTKTPSNKYLQKTKNIKIKGDNLLESHKENISFVTSLIFHYECIQMRFLADQGLSFSEWAVLLFLYNGKERNVKECVAAFKNTKNTSHKMIIYAFVSLREKGLVEKIGTGKRYTKEKITTNGIQLINKIYVQYILNF